MSTPDKDSSNNNIVFKSVLDIEEDIKDPGVPDEVILTVDDKASQDNKDEDVKESCILTEEQWSIDDYVDKTSEEILLDSILEPIKNKYQLEHQQNLASYKGRFWLYLCYIGSFKFKYGKTTNPLGRFKTHSTSFRYFEPLFLAECSNYTVSEGEFRNYIIEMKINTTHIDNNYHKQLEIFQIKLNFTHDYLRTIFKKFLKIAKDNYKKCIKLQDELKDQSNKHICQYCNKTFCSVSSFNHHQKTAKSCLKIQEVYNKNLFHCCYCDQNFSTKYNLEQHQKTTKTCYKLSLSKNGINSRELISFVCIYCKKSFTKKNYLDIHYNSCLVFKTKVELEENFLIEKKGIDAYYLEEAKKNDEKFKNELQTQKESYQDEIKSLNKQLDNGRLEIATISTKLKEVEKQLIKQENLNKHLQDRLLEKATITLQK
jgi:hypothetical protein